ncbi:unnamed protein product [Spirodela intermedia]|uniref:Uncharacterized protein n=1 Tax=Spirodela intermedia TaxID=51605 RepID=A0A7I8IKQ4_SPIIN|nr:unnamed protein product [Spirodela intermedia]CAA6658323.1 unnamed protein product [Spirodela intermedia]
MGLLSWWRGRSRRRQRPEARSPVRRRSAGGEERGAEATGMNGAEEVVRRPSEVTVFEFGSAAASGDRVTLAGYCPCRRSSSRAAGRFCRPPEPTPPSSGWSSEGGTACGTAFQSYCALAR